MARYSVERIETEHGPQWRVVDSTGVRHPATWVSESLAHEHCAWLNSRA